MCGPFKPKKPKRTGPSKAELQAQREKERERKAAGRRSLIQTGGAGVEEEAARAKKTLLGQ